MAQRRWQVRPDQSMETPDGLVGIISQDALAKAVYDGTVVLDRCGGCLSVVLRRYPTGVEGEMVTVGADVLWMDRTDARPAPEKASEPTVLRAVETPTVEDEPAVVEVDESDVPEYLRTSG